MSGGNFNRVAWIVNENCKEEISFTVVIIVYLWWCWFGCFRLTPLVATLLFWQVLSNECKLYQVLAITISESVVWIALRTRERLLQHMKIKFAYTNLHHLSTIIVHMYVIVVFSYLHWNEHDWLIDWVIDGMTGFLFSLTESCGSIAWLTCL